MDKLKTEPLPMVLYANGLILVLATLFQNSQSPYAHLVMSMLFIAWATLFVWHIATGRSSA